MSSSLAQYYEDLYNTDKLYRNLRGEAPRRINFYDHSSLSKIVTRVCFVRHGISQDQEMAVGHHPRPDSPLSQLGISQSRCVAHRLREDSSVALFTSSITRAHETASIIGEAAHLVPAIQPLFDEWRPPSSVYTWAPEEPPPENYSEVRNGCASDYAERFEDEETLVEFLQRISLARRYLMEDCSEESVVIVSHSNFIKFFVAQEITDGCLPPSQLIRMTRALEIANCGIASLVLGGTEAKSSILDSWNDVAHLSSAAVTTPLIS